MEFIPYLLLLILMYAAVFGGIILAHFTKEELKTGKRYFKLLQKLIFIALTVYVIAYFIQERGFNILLHYGMLLIILFMAAFLALNLLYKKVWFHYATLGVLASQTYHHPGMPEVVFPLVFFFGFLTGSLFYVKYKKQLITNALIHPATIFLFGIVLYFMTT